MVRDSWGRLGFDAIEDEAFFQLVLARLVEPTSKLDSLRVIAELGLVPVHLSTVPARPYLAKITNDVQAIAASGAAQ